MVVAVMAATGLLAGCVPNQQQPVVGGAPQQQAPGTVTYRVGSNTYTNQADYIAAVQREDDTAVAQVAATGQRLGGSVLVVLPTSATIRQIWTKIQSATVNLNDMLATTGEIALLTNARAVEKGHAFDSFRLIRADAPDTAGPDDGSDPDYILRFTTRHKWALSKRGGASRDVDLPPNQATRTAWLNTFNVAVLNAAADLGAGITRQAVPTAPVQIGVPGPFAVPPIAAGPITGTAFFIDGAGHAVTNAHVVPDCKAVKVALSEGRVVDATVAAKDVQNDLAVLAVPSAPLAHAHLVTGLPRQGDSVVAYGFPLGGALGAQGNLSTGIVSSLSGLANDSRMIQISAPVQQGNSGGPLLDLNGEVIGVVSSKINALKLAAVTGDITQNVNFAIKASVLLDFLGSNGVTPDTESHKKPMAMADIGDRARSFTYMVTCQR
jgi:S1-C subfamily serine protease